MRESAQDELIFDYLEGNLSPEEKAAFELLKDDSEVLDREVRLWQNTYVDEPLADVSALEKKLFIKPDSGSWTFRNSLYVITIFALVYFLVPGDAKFDKNALGSARTALASQAQSPKEIPCAIMQQVMHKLKSVVVRKEIVSRENERQNNSAETQMMVPLADEFVVAEEYVGNALSTDIKIVDDFSAPDISDREFKIVTKTKTSAGVGKKWSRKQKRAVHKKLWRDLENRNAGTFLKGDVPYVVPLNSNNF